MREKERERERERERRRIWNNMKREIGSQTCI
jgi:hypothetical protein